MVMSKTEIYRRMCGGMMVNKIGLFGPAFVLSLFSVTYLGRWIKGPEFILSFGLPDYAVFIAGAICVLSVLVLSAYLISPFWGLYYATKIKKDFGLKTLDSVFDFYKGSIGNDEMDLLAIADKHGELKPKLKSQITRLSSSSNVDDIIIILNTLSNSGIKLDFDDLDSSTASMVDSFESIGCLYSEETKKRLSLRLARFLAANSTHKNTLE